MAEMNLKNKASVEDILRQSAQEKGEDFDEVYDSIEQGIQQGSVRVLRHGNTLLVYIIHGDAVDASIATLDKPSEITEAMKSFMHTFKLSKFKKIYFDEDDQKYVQLFQMAGIPFSADTNINKFYIEV